MQPASQEHDIVMAAEAEGEVNKRIPRSTGPRLAAARRSGHLFHYFIYIPNKKLFDNGPISDAVFRDLRSKAQAEWKQHQERRLASRAAWHELLSKQEDEDEDEDEDEEEDKEEDYESSDEDEEDHKNKKRLNEHEDREMIKKRLTE